MREVIRDSITINFLINFTNIFLKMEETFEKYYSFSNFAKSISNLQNSIKNASKKSFMNRMLNSIADKSHKVEILHNSEVFFRIKRLLNTSLFNSSKNSKLNVAVCNVIKSFSSGSFLFISMTILIAATVNIITLVYFKIDVTALGWILRGSFVVVLTVGLSYRGSLKEITSTSFFIRLLRKDKSVKRT
jgi:hypothetical protein